MSIDLESLKKMNVTELENLASSLREKIINTLSFTGGHLSSNLGVVELTIALHYVFNSPKDKILFDVSHQTYVHKLLTGRYDEFDSLRTYGGLSGFSSIKESIHDSYDAGHSSTSISYALGLLEAKKTYPDLFDNAISVIGDASIVNGLSMEALNYLGSKPDQKLIIILNDNEMGISKNVGGLARTFNKIRVKNRFRLLRKIMPKFIKNMMKSIAYKKTPFSGFGIKYLGVIDGHNIKELIEYFEYAKKCPTSVILHVKTQKGKGYKFAEEDKTGIWHSTPPFDVSTGVQNVSSNNLTLFGESFSNIIDEKIDSGIKNIRVMSAGMIYGTGLSTLSLVKPEYVIDVGIAEENAVVMATGMASAGLIPFVFIYSTFLQRAYDAIIHDFAKNNSHGVLCLDRSGIVDGDGPTHQGIYDVAYLSTIPNLNILAPRNIGELKSMVDYVINHRAPYAIRYPKYCFSESSVVSFNLKWEIIKESKNKKYIISYGPVVDSFNKLLHDSEVGLINASTIKPIDKELIKELLINNNELYLYEEVISTGSLKQSVISYASNLYLDKVITSFNISSKVLPDTYLEVGSKEELLDLYHMNINEFIKEVEAK